MGPLDEVERLNGSGAGVLLIDPQPDPMDVQALEHELERTPNRLGAIPLIPALPLQPYTDVRRGVALLHFRDRYYPDGGSASALLDYHVRFILP